MSIETWYQFRIVALKTASVVVARSPADMGTAVKEAIARRK